MSKNAGQMSKFSNLVYANVDGYIASQAEESHSMLEEIRDIIKTAIPDAEEVVHWNAPFYKYHGKLIAGFAAYKHHLRFGIVGADIDSDIRKKLDAQGYTTLERGLQIRYDQKIPTKELSQLLNLTKIHHDATQS
ncbi:MAG: DUF1801 domain-containing protein [Clostridiales Family XIII bacterium]|nr:DUF1801 domain-containing protein [Clostridiales Family XIII bacterium]